MFEIRGFLENSASGASVPTGMLRTLVLPEQPETQDVATPWPAPGSRDLGHHLVPFWFHG